MLSLRKKKNAKWGTHKTVQNLIDFCKAGGIPLDTPMYMTVGGKSRVLGIYFHEISGLTFLDVEE